MTDYIDVNLRDGIELSRAEWVKFLNEDLDAENATKTWDIRGAVMTDIGNGRDIELNGHLYQQRIHTLYDSAKELLDEVIVNNPNDILEILEKMTEETIAEVVMQLENVEKKDGKYLLKDKGDD